MNAKLVSTAADVIARAMTNGRQTPAGWAVALESAQLLQSPETAAELAKLRAQVAEDRAAPLAWARLLDAKSLDNFMCALGMAADTDPADGALSQVEEMIRSFRSAIAPGAEEERSETLHDHVVARDAEIERLRARVAELEDKKELADRERVELQTGLERALTPFCEDPTAAAVAAAEVRHYDAAWFQRDAQRLLDRIAELEAAPVTVYRASHDSIVMGLYTTREAAQAHCETKVQQKEPAGSIRHMSWSADDIGDFAEYELHITPAGTGELIRGTGYVVTPLEVAASYDEEADE